MRSAPPSPPFPSDGCGTCLPTITRSRAWREADADTTWGALGGKLEGKACCVQCACRVQIRASGASAGIADPFSQSLLLAHGNTEVHPRASTIQPSLSWSECCFRGNRVLTFGACWKHRSSGRWSLRSIAAVGHAAQDAEQVLRNCAVSALLVLLASNVCPLLSPHVGNSLHLARFRQRLEDSFDSHPLL